MIVTFALLAQAVTLAANPAPKAAPIRVWIADSTVYVRLRDPGYLTVLHVDPVGRIRVLFPATPDDDAAAPGGGTYELPAPVSTDGGTGTIVAARIRQPLRVAGLRAGPFWDYDHGMLFQPTAGNATAALLDIADRMADGHPFDFDVTTYRTGGPALARDPQLTTPVCLSCVRSNTVVQQSTTITINQSNIVDCSNAVLVNSFCGVVDNRVTNTYEYNEAAPAPEPIYIPYYVPMVIPRRRPRAAPPPQPPPQRTLAIAFPLRRASAVVVPPPPGRRPVIDVKQPRQRYAPIEPRQREETDGGSAPPAALPPPAVPSAAAPAVPRVVNWVSAGMPVRAPVSWEPSATRPAEPAARVPERRAGTIAAPTTQARTFVASSDLLRTIRTRPH